MDDNSIELVIRLQNGEKSAFEKLFELYKIKAVRTAYLLTNNKALAEDIAQEAFVQCYLKINELKKPERFKTWFFRTLTRIAWRMSTKEKEVVPVEDIFDMSDYTDIEQMEQFIKKETSENLMEAINGLEEKQKTVVLLYYYNEFSIAEIASIMKCFEGTVKSRLYTARKNLKKKILLEEKLRGEGQNDAVIYKV